MGVSAHLACQSCATAFSKPLLNISNLIWLWFMTANVSQLLSVPTGKCTSSSPPSWNIASPPTPNKKKKERIISFFGDHRLVCYWSNTIMWEPWVQTPWFFGEFPHFCHVEALWGLCQVWGRFELIDIILLRVRNRGTYLDQQLPPLPLPPGSDL